MSMPVQAQWAIATTEEGQFSAYKGFLSAATRDNVQVVSLAVCQAFGNTLAIHGDAIKEVGKRLFPASLPGPTVFLQASIGYSENDSATALGRTLSGQRFLCLAAALVTSVGPFDGAQAIRAMMQASKLDEGLAIYIPTTRQLENILKSLEARLALCGFLDLMMAWEIRLREKTSTEAKLSPAQNLMLKGLPRPEIIAKIVGALGQIARWSHGSVSGVTVKVGGAGTVWLLAFVQWCFFTKPAVCINEESNLDSTASPVRVIV